MVFYAALTVISRRQLTLFVSFLGFTSTRLGSEVSCPRTLPRKNPEDTVQLEPRTTGLRVKHFTTETRRILSQVLTRLTKYSPETWENEKMLDSSIFSFSHHGTFFLTLSQTSHSSLCVDSASLLKTLWEKEKLLIANNFSISHSIFYLF